jgi:cobalt-zinc-cadmium efflux system outer membrane protein
VTREAWAWGLAGLLSLCSAVAGAAEPITLEALLGGLDRAFPSVLAARQDQQVAAAEVQQAEGGFDPSWRTRAGWVPLGYYDTARLDSVVQQATPWWGASLFGGYRVGGGNFADYDGKSQTLEWGEVRSGITLPLLRDRSIDKRRAELWSAQQEPELAKAALDGTRLEVKRLAALRFWTWVEAGRTVEIARQQLSLAEDRDGGLAERVRRGDLADIERQDNRRTILARRNQLVAAEQRLATAALELSLYLRDADGKPRVPRADELPPSLTPPAPLGPEADGQARALRQRPEFRRFAAQRSQYAIDVAQAENGQRLGVDVQAALSKDFGSSKPSLAPLEVEVGLMLDVPLLVRQARGKEQAARAKIAKVSLGEQLLTERVSVEVRDVHVQWLAAAQRLALARDELALAQRLAEAERAALLLGNATVLVVNLREQAVAEAALREVTALADLQRIAAVWRAVTADWLAP